MKVENAITNLGLIYNGFIAPVSKEQQELITETFLMAVEALKRESKTGHWIRQKSPYGDTHTYECSECGRTIYAEDGDLSDFPYCHCGAKMEVEE